MPAINFPLQNAVSALWSTARIFDALEVVKITRVELSYSGGHDSGGIDAVHWYRGDDTCTLIDRDAEILRTEFGFPSFLFTGDARLTTGRETEVLQPKFQLVNPDDSNNYTAAQWQMLLSELMEAPLYEHYQYGFDNEPVVQGTITWNVIERTISMMGEETTSEYIGPGYDYDDDNENQEDPYDNDDNYEHTVVDVDIVPYSCQACQSNLEDLLCDAIQWLATAPRIAALQPLTKHLADNLGLEGTCDAFAVNALVYADAVEELGCAAWAAEIRSVVRDNETSDNELSHEQWRENVTISALITNVRDPIEDTAQVGYVINAPATLFDRVAFPGEIRRLPVDVATGQELITVYGYAKPALSFTCTLGIPVCARCDEVTWDIFGDYLCAIFPITHIDLVIAYGRETGPVVTKYQREGLTVNADVVGYGGNRAFV